MKGVLVGKSIFVFDWDGTLLDSMLVKFRTFSEVLAECLRGCVFEQPSDLVERLRGRYEALSGKPRRDIVNAILSEYRVPGEAFDFEAFSTRLSEVNRRELASQPLFPDAVEFLRSLAATPAHLYVSSSVPQAELGDLVASRMPEDVRQRLTGVFGSNASFVKGLPHVERILKDSRGKREDLLFFGDDVADAALCREAGVDCVLVDRRGRLAGAIDEVYRVSDFTALTNQIAVGQSG